MDGVTFEGAIKWHVQRIRSYSDLFEHEVTRANPDKVMLRHYMDSMQAHMRMAADAALVLSGEVLEDVR